MNTAKDHLSIIDRILTKKGQFTRAVWKRACDTKKSVQDVISKRTELVVRAGIDYENLASVQHKRAVGELPPENAGLPWGTWVQFPYIIEHNGNYYLRLYPNGQASRVDTWFKNGAEVSFDSISEYLLAKELRADNPDCITVKLENMEELS